MNKQNNCIKIAGFAVLSIALISAIGLLPLKKVSAAVGTVKISQVKDINSSVFPSDPAFVATFNASVPISVMDVDGSSPALLASGGIWAGSAGPGGGGGGQSSIGPVFAAISDPSSPAYQVKYSWPTYSIANVTGGLVWHNSPVPESPAIYSKDGTFAALNPGDLFSTSLFTLQSGYSDPFVVGASGRGGIISSYGGNTVLISEDGTEYNLTGMTPACGAGNKYTCIKGINRVNALAALPSTFPVVSSGKKVMLSDSKYFASFNQNYGTPAADGKVVVYDATQSNPVASVNGPSTLKGYAQFFKQRAAGADYLFVLDPGSIYPGSVYSPAISVYKFTYATKTLEVVKSDLSLNINGSALGAGGLNLGGNVGFFAFITGADGNTKLHVYMLSDLAAGSVVDSLIADTNSTSGGSFGSTAASYSSGSSAYIYFSNAQGKLNSIKLDSVVVGSPAPGAGASVIARISTVKDITKILYPNNTLCPGSPESGLYNITTDPCVKNQQPLNIPLKLVDTFNPPALIHADISYPDGRGVSGGGTSAFNIGDAYSFGLSDPLNPTIVKKVTMDSQTMTSLAYVHNPYVLFGYLNHGGSGENGIAFSKDGVYSGLGCSTLGCGYLESNGKFIAANEDYVGVVNYGGKFFSIANGNPSMDITNWPQNLTQVRGKDVLNLPGLPASFPHIASSASDQKLILTQDKYIAVLGPGSGNSATLSVYDLGKTNAVATVSFPANSCYTGGGCQFFRQQDAGADYLFVRSDGVIYAFKFIFSSNTLQTIVNGVSLGSDIGEGATGVKINGSVGILALATKALNSISNGVMPATSYQSTARVYMLSDLAAGNIVNVLDNSPSTTINLGTNEAMYDQPFSNPVSLTVGNSTYVYVMDYGNPGGIRIFAWKLDGSGSGTPPPPPSGCSSGVNPHYETNSAGVCTVVQSCGTSNCTPGGGISAGTCGYTWTASPQSQTVTTGVSSVSYQINVTKASDAGSVCILSASPESVRSEDNSRNIITGSSVQVPLGSTVNLNYTLSTPPASTYTLPVHFSITSGGYAAPQTASLSLTVNSASSGGGGGSENQNQQAQAPSASATYVFNVDLHQGMTHPDVLELQKYLNNHGFQIASSGSGSSGNETTYFGSKTKKALSDFQKSVDITPPQGFFGPTTRAYVNSH